MFNFLIVFIALSSLFLFIKNTKTKRESERLANLWPEIIESIISGLIAGVSIQETWINVSQQYPKFKAFREFLMMMQVENNLEKSLLKMKAGIADGICDQVIEIMLFSLRFGGNDTIKLLRNLAEAISRELELNSEIQARFGWVKNSAALATISPWVIFAILNFQGNSRAAFANSIGHLILIVAAVLSLISYVIIEQIAKLPKPKRVFLKVAAELK